MNNNDTPLYDDIWNYREPAETAVQFHNLLPGVEAAGDLSAHVQLLTQIARTQSLQHKFEEAHAILDQAEALLTADLSVARIRYFLERGRSFNSANKKEMAIPLFQEAFDLSVATSEEFYAIDAAHMLGIATPPASQLTWNLKAMALAEKTENKRARQWLGALYNNIGWTYHDMDDFEKALELFQKSLHWRQNEAEPKKDIPIRIAKWTIARTYRSLNRIEDALALQQALLVEQEAAESQDGYVFEELGECLLALNRKEEATPYFAQAYQLLSQDPWLKDNEKGRLQRLKTLGI